MKHRENILRELGGLVADSYRGYHTIDGSRIPLAVVKTGVDAFMYSVMLATNGFKYVVVTAPHKIYERFLGRKEK